MIRKGPVAHGAGIEISRCGLPADRLAKIFDSLLRPAQALVSMAAMEKQPGRIGTRSGCRQRANGVAKIVNRHLEVAQAVAQLTTLSMQIAAERILRNGLIVLGQLAPSFRIRV